MKYKNKLHWLLGMHYEADTKRQAKDACAYELFDKRLDKCHRIDCDGLLKDCEDYTPIRTQRELTEFFRKWYGRKKYGK